MGNIAISGDNNSVNLLVEYLGVLISMMEHLV